MGLYPVEDKENSKEECLRGMISVFTQFIVEWDSADEKNDYSMKGYMDFRGLENSSVADTIRKFSKIGVTIHAEEMDKKDKRYDKNKKFTYGTFDLTSHHLNMNVGILEKEARKKVVKKKRWTPKSSYSLALPPLR